MYSVTVSRDFVAQHWLTVPDAGPENKWHSHAYTAELQLEGPSLNEYGYLVDIIEVEDALNTVIGRFEDETLNEMEEFEGLNPSIEHFSRIIWNGVEKRIETDHLKRMTIKLWEDDEAWAAYNKEL